MKRQVTTPAIPDLDQLIAPEERRVLEAVKETIEVREGRRGGKTDSFVTWRDLVNLGLIEESDIPS